MSKKFYFSVLAMTLLIFSLNSPVLAEDSQKIDPILSSDSISTVQSQIDENRNSGRLMVQNTPSLNGENDALDEDLIFDEYDDTTTSQSVADPLYYFNYAMYSFNDVLYTYALEPIASGYKWITPSPIRNGVKNFFHNLLFPVRFVNNLLQGEIKDAGVEIEIFIINTTIGVLGFGQIAQSQFDLHTSNEDLGQTLGSYSIGNGFYLVLPVFGPSTLRDTVGLVGDYFLKPVNYVEPWELSTGLKAYDTINTTSFRLGDYEALKSAALDPYVALRDAYIQNRKNKIKE